MSIFLLKRKLRLMALLGGWPLRPFIISFNAGPVYLVVILEKELINDQEGALSAIGGSILESGGLQAEAPTSTPVSIITLKDGGRYIDWWILKALLYLGSMF